MFFLELLKWNMHYIINQYLHAKIKCRLQGDTGMDGQVLEYLLDTTPGRVLISELLPQDGRINFDMINKTLNKKKFKSHRYSLSPLWTKKYVMFADKIMQLGFRYACKSRTIIGRMT